MKEESRADKGKIRKQHIIMLVILLVVCFFAGMKYQAFLLQQQPQSGEAENPVLTEIETETPEIMVHVKGAVDNPGVLQLPAGSRVLDAVHAAGVSVDADIESINLSRILNDQDEVIVPDKNVATEAPGVSGSTNGKLNINSATSEQLQDLPGIGPVKADSIITYRENFGSFNSIEELKEISGISESLFVKIKDDICV